MPSQPTTYQAPPCDAAASPPPTRRRGRLQLAALASLCVLTTVAGWMALGGTAPSSTGGSEGAEASTDAETDAMPDADELLAAARPLDAGGLDPGLEAALEEARRAAAAEGIELPVVSGYRSAEEQLALLEAEIVERGSREEAMHWVFPPDRSMHVRGLAVDVNDGPGADWLQRHGARYGLCKTLRWEWWHFEWRERWQDEGRCPPAATTPDEAPEG